MVQTKTSKKPSDELVIWYNSFYHPSVGLLVSPADGVLIITIQFPYFPRLCAKLPFFSQTFKA